MNMNKLIGIIFITLFILLSGCVDESDNKPKLDIVSNNIVVWEDSTGELCIKLFCEVTNTGRERLHLKASDFEIVDENGNLIEVMKQVNAYPPIIEPGKTSVYSAYIHANDAEKVLDLTMELSTIPKIETEISKIKLTTLPTSDVTSGGIVVVENPSSSREEYKNIQIAVIRRNENNEIFAVLTTKINSLKPGERVEARAQEPLVQENLQYNKVEAQFFVYIDP